MLRVLLPSHTNSKYIVLLVFFALIMAHTLQVFTLKGCTIHWISRITFSITWQGVDVKRVQFLVRLLFRRDCSP